MEEKFEWVQSSIKEFQLQAKTKANQQAKVLADILAMLEQHPLLTNPGPHVPASTANHPPSQNLNSGTSCAAGNGCQSNPFLLFTPARRRGPNKAGTYM